MIIIVVSLNKEDVATDEDRACRIVSWVHLFKATTWEELTMVAEKNDYMASAIETVYLSNEDYNVRKIARERDEFLRHQAYREAKIAKQEEIIAEKDSIIAEMDNTMKKQDSEIAALKEEVAKLEAQISDTKQ